MSRPQTRLGVDFKCPHCGKVNDRHRSATTMDDVQPDHKDMSLCWSCKQPSVYWKDEDALRLITLDEAPLTDEERAEKVEQLRQIVATIAGFETPEIAADVLAGTFGEPEQAILRFYGDEDCRELDFEYAHPVDRGWPPPEVMMMAQPVEDQLIRLLLVVRFGPQATAGLMVPADDYDEWANHFGDLTDAYDKFWYRRVSFGDGNLGLADVMVVKGAKYVRGARS